MSTSKNIWGLVGDMPPWGKAVLVIGVLGIGTVTGVTIYKGIKRKKEQKDANTAAIDSQKELVELQKDGIVPTISESQFEGMCQSLVQSMNGCGTDEDMVYDIFKKLNNEADIRKLIAKFGIRYYEPCAADQPISYAKWWWDDKSFGGALPTWLSYDLNAGDKGKVNAILSQKGITYRF